MPPSTDRCAPPGEIVQRCDSGKPRLVRTKGKTWSDAAERRFLETLAATCNVGRAAEAAGFPTLVAYRRRLKHAGFADRWAAALETGYIRLEFAVLEAANDTLTRDEDFDLDRPIPRMTIAEALAVLRQHRANVGQGGRPGKRWHVRTSDPEKARENILKKVAAVRRAKYGATAE